MACAVEQIVRSSPIPRVVYKMLDLDPSHQLPSYPLEWLEQNPSLSNLLLADCDYDLEEVSEIIKPVLTAPQRCRRGLYVQAVVTGQTAFLATNLLQEHIAIVSPVSSSWLIGRSTVCPIRLSDRSVSRCHAVMGHSSSGFYITDLGSLNGTWINAQRLGTAERVDLEDGDLVQFGTVSIEFFLSKRETETLPVYFEETTCY